MEKPIGGTVIMADKPKPTHVVETVAGKKLTINGKRLAQGVELTDREVEILNAHPNAAKREVKLRRIDARAQSSTPSP
jgi:hypothetical protein